MQLKVLVEAASCVLILTYALACLSVIVLRESGLQNYRPAFRAPLYPWLQIAGILGLGFVLFELGIEAYFISAGLILVAFLTFWFYGRPKERRESALLHLVARLTDQDDLVGGEGGLEEELREIIRERDEIVADRFDRLVESAPVLDIQEGMREPMKQEAFFRRVAGELAPRIGVDVEDLVGRLMERESKASTVISPTLAAPHIVVEGEGCFEMLIARVVRGGRLRRGGAQGAYRLRPGGHPRLAQLPTCVPSRRWPRWCRSASSRSGGWRPKTNAACATVIVLASRKRSGATWSPRE